MFFFKKYIICLGVFSFLFFSLAFGLHVPQPLFYSGDLVWHDSDFYEVVLKSDWDNFSSEKKAGALEDFIKTELAFVAAQKEGLFLHPDVKQKLSNQYLFSLINATYKEKIAKPLIGLKDVEKNKENLKTQIETYHLLIGFSGSKTDTESTLTQQEALEKIDSLFFVINDYFLQSNGSVSLVDSFKKTASVFSIDPSVKTNQGYLGWVPWGQTVMSFQKPLFEAEFNVLSGPILTEYGYHLILKINQKNSDFFYFSEESYNNLSWAIAENSLSFDNMRASAAEFDSLMIKDVGFKVNPLAVSLVFEIFTKKGVLRGSNIDKELEGLRLSPLVLFVMNGRGYGVGWLINKLKKTSPSKLPYIKNKNNLISLLQTFALQDIVFDMGRGEKINSSSVFKRDVDRFNKNIIYNEYIKFLLHQLSPPDSLVVLNEYNNSVLSGMFIEPKRVVFSEIRVFDMAVAQQVYERVLFGDSFDLLLKEFGGSIKEPLSLGKKNNSLTQKAFTLGVGEISSIIKNNQGSFSILRVEAFLEETPFSLDRVYSQIERDLVVEKQEKTKLGLFNFLLENFNVLINYSVVGL